MTEFEIDLLTGPVALRPDVLHALFALSRAAPAHKSGDPTAGPRSSRRSDAFAGALRATSGVAALPLFGALSKRAPGWLWPFATSSIAFAAVFDEALADPSVKAVVIEIDSPGGTVDAGQELANHLFAARGQKPVFAIANSSAASAAYWIGSQADRLFITPGGQAGSIGVYAAHEDFSRALESAGVKVSLVSAGKYKTEQSPFGPLSSEARAHLQDQVDEAYTRFVGAVARGRDVSPEFVRKSMGGGRMLMASKAVAAHLVDGIATLDQVVRRASAIQGGARVESARAQLDRAQRMQCATPKVAAMREDLERSLQSLSANAKPPLH